MGTVMLHAAALHGAEPVPVTIEVGVSGGLPGIDIIGLPDAAVSESRYRVRSALSALGFEGIRAHITVNLAPAEVKKTGTGFDLPIAVGVLLATAQIPPQGYDGYLLTGELGLNGGVSGVRGGVALALAARNAGLGILGNLSDEVASSCGVELLRLTNIAQLRGGLAALERVEPGSLPDAAVSAPCPDFADVVDQEAAKRALVIAAAGKHCLLMVGPPGSGKSMLARCLPSILPRLTERERLETMLVHSVAGEPTEAIAAGLRPFRSPHHSVTSAGLIGGGSVVTPGEVSLANNGVLFLDELPEFAPAVLQALRQPLEDHVVHLVRAESTYSFPANVQLLAAANPCPCGYLGDPDHVCRCTDQAVRRYQGRVGGPIMDRIDIHVTVARPDPRKVVRGDRGTGSSEMADAVARGVEFRGWREARGGGEARPQLTAQFERGAVELLEAMGSSLALGGRGITRVSRVARTIADLDEAELVREQDVAEAIAYRVQTNRP